MSYSEVFKNSHFIIVDKAPNVLSVPSRLGTADPRPCLGRILEIDLGMTIYPVHRLDYEVQGLILYALTPEAQRAGNAWFEKKEIQKIYSAITKANNSKESFKVGEIYEWKCTLLRGKKRAYESPHGKDSQTIAKLTRIDDLGYSHWELEPVTGRAHQLRFELFRHEEYIIGDSLYGSNEKYKKEGIALRSFKIDFSKIKNRNQFSLPEIISTKKLE